MTEILKDSLEDSTQFAAQSNSSLEAPAAIVTSITTEGIFSGKTSRPNCVSLRRNLAALPLTLAEILIELPYTRSSSRLVDRAIIAAEKGGAA